MVRRRYRGCEDTRRIKLLQGEVEDGCGKEKFSDIEEAKWIRVDNQNNVTIQGEADYI